MIPFSTWTVMPGVFCCLMLRHVPIPVFIGLFLAVLLQGPRSASAQAAAAASGTPTAASSAAPTPTPPSATTAAPLQMEKFEVGARQEAFYNSIDRKVYHVGQDIVSATGSTSDLLQNVPSVQVDVEGNVSLRGDTGVEILINGKPSALMGRNRAAVLEQMPADSIERVEVITNPSAKFKPDGTGGIINLVLKRERGTGLVGSFRANVGNDERYNAGINASFGTARTTLHGSLSFRQDDRARLGQQERVRLDDLGHIASATTEESTEHTRPFSRLARVGADYHFDRKTKFSATFTYDDRRSDTDGTQLTLVRDAAGATTRHTERIRRGREIEDEAELEFLFEHEFAAEGRELTAELSLGKGKETEDEVFDNRSLLADAGATTDARREHNVESEFQFSTDYVHALAAGAKLELGYEAEHEKTDLDFQARRFDASTALWVTDATATNRFVHDSTIHALYGTYGRPFGKFGVLAGVRYEHAFLESDQRTTGVSEENSYGRVYPSLHLSYDLREGHQLQLSYSHRVNRPDGDDLNPFPSYDDPFNLRAGNPRLEPEDTHAIEAGYQIDQGDTTYLAALYFRHRYHGITEVTRYIDATTVLTTPENLATSRSAGLELGATRRFGEALALNFSGNVYQAEVDAANLGFSDRRSAIAWDAKLNLDWKALPRLRVQVSSSYAARRLTAQGERDPWHITNVGLRYDLKDNRAAIVLTASDVFNSMKFRNTIDTPTLRGVSTRARSSQIVYLGLVYNFGRGGKSRDTDLEFDETL